MKWHICDSSNYPLAWDDNILEFDSCESAERFLISANDAYLGFEDSTIQTEFNNEIEDCPKEEAHIDATNMIVVYDSEIDEEKLVEVNNNDED